MNTVEGGPDRVVVVDRDRVVDPSLRRRLPDAVELVLEGELRGVDADDDQPVGSVGLDQARMYGSWRSQLMHVRVQKFTRTTWPRSSAGPSGAELSHSVAPPSGGMCRGSTTVTYRSDLNAARTSSEKSCLRMRVVTGHVGLWARRITPIVGDGPFVVRDPETWAK